MSAFESRSQILFNLNKSLLMDVFERNADIKKMLISNLINILVVKLNNFDLRASASIRS